MKIERLSLVLTIVNLGLLLFLVSQIPAVRTYGVPSVLRGRALQIVDARGRARASIDVLAGDRTPSGTPSPETVILRLIDANGRPSVKLAMSEQGAGLSLVGATDATYVVLKAEGAESSLKLINQEGKQQVIQP